MKKSFPTAKKSDIKILLDSQRQFFTSGKTKDIGFRIEQLKKLESIISNNENKIYDALNSDLKRSPFETYKTEIGIVLSEIKHAIKKLPDWARISKVKTPFKLLPARSYIYKEPLGLSLIIAPWNYPFQLLLAPLIGSIAAGNCSIFKASEYTPATSSLIFEMFSTNFDKNYLAPVEGDATVGRELVSLPFDHIFFTGGKTAAKSILKAAADNLTPVTLELGGKSPCIIDKDADIEIAARRVAWGKFINAGQTCVAPDYLILHREIKTLFLDKLIENIKCFYGDNPFESQDYPRIVNEKHFDHLSKFLNTGSILTGGDSKRDELYIAPTVIDNISLEDKIMSEEIFGPILPVLTYSDIDEVKKTVLKNPNPLALYFFSKNRDNQEKILKEISFGGGCINDTILHLASPLLPFGGVGESGMGRYRGEAGFDTFSNHKSILKNNFPIDIPLRYPPYKNKLWLLKWFLR